MMAAPNARSSGLGAAAGATLAAFTGMSAANAGAAETASAVTTDNKTLFITLPLFRFDRQQADPSARPCVLAPAAIDPYATGRASMAKITQVTEGRGKTKTAAIAAFLGEQAPYRQFESCRCGETTIAGGRAQK